MQVRESVYICIQELDTVEKECNTRLRIFK